MNQIKEKFLITLRLDEDNYYYLIALLMAYLYNYKSESNGYTAEEIKQIGQDLSIAKIVGLNNDKVVAFMEELVELNVFRKTDDTHYRFSRYTFFQMMGTNSEIEDRLMEQMESIDG